MYFKGKGAIFNDTLSFYQNSYNIISLLFGL